MTLPTAPSRTMDQDTFDAATDAFIGALPQFEIDMNALAAAMTLNATTDTSTSSVAIGTGSKTFTVTAGKSFVPGMWLVIADTAAPTTNAMYAQVSSYSGTTLVVNSVTVQGSGTIASWQISQTVRANDVALLSGSTFTGAVTFNDVITAAGGSIVFPASQSASADPNAFDDYQEASYSFTPTATTGTFTTVTGVALHTKVGNVCTVAVEIIITDAGTAADDILYTIPYTALLMSGKYNGVGAAKEVQATGVAGVQSLNSSTQARISKYDGTTLIASGRTITGTLTFLTV